MKKAIQKCGFVFKNVVVAQVLSVSDHPKNKRHESMSVVTVDDGRKHLVVVCTQMTADIGQLIPLAPVGSMVGDSVITSQKVRGIESFGLLCRCALHIFITPTARRHS